MKVKWLKSPPKSQMFFGAAGKVNYMIMYVSHAKASPWDASAWGRSRKRGAELIHDVAKCPTKEGAMAACERHAISNGKQKTKTS